MDGLKSAPCTDCGLCFPPAAMDFDHVRGVKTANISNLVGEAWERIEAELELTELVCANCHRLRTETRRLDLYVDAALLEDVVLDIPCVEGEA